MFSLLSNFDLLAKSSGKLILLGLYRRWSLKYVLDASSNPLGDFLSQLCFISKGFFATF